MAKLQPLIAMHPLGGSPYDKLEFVGHNHHRVPLYRVRDSDQQPSGALEALGRAFAKYGGKCFYCPAKFAPQPLSPETVHRDHVVAVSAGGSDLLHNLVIACTKCGRTKANDTIHDFRPRAAKDYFSALERHIAKCVRGAD